MSTHNMPLSILEKKITLIYPKFAALGFFTRDSRTSRNSCSKQAISVRATEVLLYNASP